jgi:hypothetical protein
MLQNVDLIIERAKQGLGIKTDRALASYFGIKPNTISAWKKRNSVNYELLFTKCASLHKEWLLTGEGEMYVNKEGPTGAGGEKKGGNQHNAEGDRAQNDTTPVQHPQNTRLTPAQQPLNANAKTHATPAQPPPYSQATPAQQIANANNDAPAPALPYSRLTPAQQVLNANASSIAIKTHPFLYEAIGYRLAVHELDIIEGDILVIDPTLTAESGDIILRSSPEGPELAKYQSGEKNTKGIVVGLTRQYPAIHRQPSQEPPAG